jgi:hypothetical protein
MDTRIERISCFIGGGFATAMKRHEHVLGVFVGGTERVLGKTPLGDPWRSFALCRTCWRAWKFCHSRQDPIATNMAPAQLREVQTVDKTRGRPCFIAMACDLAATIPSGAKIPAQDQLRQ